MKKKFYKDVLKTVTTGSKHWGTIETNTTQGAKSISKILFLFSILFGFGNMVSAQVTVTGGSSATAGSPYTTLSAAISAINAGGAFTAPVVVNVAAGHTEVLTSAIVLNATGTAANTLTIQKNGAGANPVLSGYTGTFSSVGSTGYDAMFVLNGSDYVTINGINLNNAGATSATTAMELGYVLARSSGTNGAQNNTIMNCVVSMSAEFGTNCISIVDYSISSNTAVVPTSIDGTNSNNTIKSCTLSGSNTPVFLRSFNAPSPYTLGDTGNKIGGNLATDGNTIINYGGYGTGASNAVFVNHQWNYLVKYNLINNNNGSHINHPGTALRGVFCNISSQGASGEVSFNDISLKYGGSQTGSTISATTVNVVAGIDMRSSDATSSGNIIKVNNNYIHNIRYSVAATNPCAGIVLGTLASNVECNNNDITDIQFATTSAATYFYGIINLLNVPTFLKINGNNIHDIVNLNSSTTVHMVSTNTATPNLEFKNNNIDNITRAAGLAGILYGYYNNGSPTPTGGTSTINDNTVSNLTNGTGTLYGINNTTLSTQICIQRRNTVSNLTSGGTASIYGMNTTVGAVGSWTDSNTVSNITSTGSGIIYGLYCAGSTSTVPVSHNVIENLTTGGTIYGLYIGGANQDVYRNRISGLTSTTVSTNPVYGVYLTTGSQTNVYNNQIFNLTNNNTTSLFGLVGMYVSTTSAKILNNTIYPTSNTPFTGGTNGGAAGIYYVSSGTATYEIENNIISLSGANTGNGYIAAIMKSAVGSAGTPVAGITLKGNILSAPYIYGEGTTLSSATNVFHTGAGTTGTADLNFNTSCGLFKTFMAGNAVGTFTENNLSPVSVGYAPTGASFAESGVIANSFVVNKDFFGVTRGTPGDIGAVEFAGSGTDAVGPIISFTDIPNQNCLNTPTLVSTITDVSGVNAVSGSAPRIYYKKSTEANVYSPTSSNNSSYNGWKWVQATGSGTNYSFTLNYALLTSPVAVGNTIEYFVVAADLASSPNLGKNQVTFASGCPTSVSLPAVAFPASGYLSYSINPAATISVSASPTTVCTGNNVTLIAKVTNTGEATVGTGTLTSSTSSPYSGTTTAGRRNQFIFTPAELNAAGIFAGPISAIAMDITTTTATQLIPDLIIKMGHTSTSIATTAYLTDPATTVRDYSGSGGYMPVFGINNHTFTTAFVWDGTSNLFIEMCHGALAGSATLSVRYQASVGNKVTYSANVAGCGFTGTGSATTTRPFVTFSAQVSVANLFNYTWSNGAGSVGSNNDTIVAQPTFPSGPVTYTATATDASGCSVNANTVVSQNTSTPTGTAASNNSTVCIGSPVNLSSTATGGCPPYAYSWSNGTSVVSTAANFSATPTATTTYTLTITDNASQVFTPAGVTVTVNNPTISTTTPGTRCGTGTVNLQATGSGSGLNWYTAPSGGAPIGSGSPFTTPTISSTTDFYVASNFGGSTGNVAPLTPQSVGAVSSSTIAIGTQYLRFNVLVPTTLTSVDVFPTTAGPGSISIANSTGTILIDVPYTSTVADGVTPVTVVLNYAIAVGTDYRMGQGTAKSLNRNTTGAVYPYTSPAINITGNSFDPVYYYFFYNWIFSTGCEGARTAVTATVTTAPALTISSASSTICAGTPSGTVNVTSPIANYNSYVWSPATNVSGTTSATFSPSTGTTYTLTATNSTSGCANTVTHGVVVNDLPPLTVNATPNPVCEGANVSLVASSTPAVPYSMNTAGTAPYININATGTLVTGLIGDDTEHDITFPAFTFNGVSYTTARVGLNGTVALGVSGTGNTALTNTVLPTNATNGGGPVFLAPYWDDLDVQLGATIKTETVGNIHVIQFTDITHNNFITGTIEFQVQLNLVTGEVHFVYADVIFGDPLYDSGASATVGVQFSITSAIQASFNTASLTNGQTITFAPNNNSLSWSGPNSFSSSNAANTLTAVTPAAGGLYTVVATGANSCTKTETLTLVVKQSTSSTTTASAASSYTWNANGTTYTSSGVYSHTLVNAAGCDSNLTLNLTIGTSANFNLTVFVEGYYIPASSPAAMTPVMYNNFTYGGPAANPTDVVPVTVELWPNAGGAAYSATGILADNGSLSVTFPAAAIGNPYWISVTTANTLRTFSANSVTIATTNTYNFTTSASQAATDGSGDAMAMLATGLYGLRSGDINQDDFIDGSDYSVFESQVPLTLSVFNMASDLNGDGFVDGSDYPIFDVNSAAGYYAQYPSFL